MVSKTLEPQLETTPVQASELIEMFTALNYSGSVEEMATNGALIKERLDSLSREQSVAMLNEMLQERTRAEVEFRRPVLFHGDRVINQADDTWNEKPWEVAESDSALDGARAYSKQIKPRLQNDGQSIIDAVDPRLPDWQRIQASNQLIGALSVKIGPPPAAE
ncbi:MAG: hypothetical protein WC851_01885 [Candidatus Shapirobacteria bacterium]|jgi:hypothetical protein